MKNTKTDFDEVESVHSVSEDRLTDLLACVSDISITLDRDGLIAAISVNPGNRSLGCLDHWQGRDIRSFLTIESIPKLDNHLEALRGSDDLFRQRIELNHVDNASWEFPIRYTLFKSGVDDRIIMIGQDQREVAEMQQQLVRTQVALERDYEKFRYFDTRFRALMEASSEAFVFVDAEQGRIADINRAAAELLGSNIEALTGSYFVSEFDNGQKSGLLDTLTTAKRSSPPITLLTKRNRKQLTINPTYFRAAGEMLLLCRLELAEQSEPVVADLNISLNSIYDSGTDAIVFTDHRGVILHANEGFMSICDATQIADVENQSLGEYLARGGVDLKVLLENAARTGRMRVYATKVVSAFGGQTAVEISATRLGKDAEAGFGFVIRDISRMDGLREAASPVTDQTVKDVMELVGSAPLKDIVAATTDVVEKMCIETAVDLTHNNRVAAAEMLGLSRQSLYVKLRKYNLKNKNEAD